MFCDRRRILLGAASTAALGVLNGSADALDANTKTFSDQTGLRNVDVLPQNLRTLLEAQQNSTSVPATRPGFTQYVANSAIVQAIKGGQNSDFNHLMVWHALILDLSALDHTTIAGTDDRTFAEQFGPARTSRAFGIFHLALFETVNAIYRTHGSYKNLQAKILADAGVPASAVTPATASVPLAIAYAAYGVLQVLYKNKSQLSQVVFELLVALAPPATDSAKALGRKIGESTARKVLAIRQYDPKTGAFGDGSEDIAGVQSLSVEPTYARLQNEGVLPKRPSSIDWQPDPIVPNNVALGGHWNRVTPFVLGRLPLLPPFPAVDAAAFRTTYADVRAEGGDPNPPNIAPRFPTGTTRTGTDPNAPLNESNHTFTGRFWGYDATALVCAPPRLYNMIATSIALSERPITRVDNMAYYLALVNIAVAEAGIACWANKYHYHIARPVTYIRATNPSQVTLGTANGRWTPQGGPNTNGPVNSSNFSPPFPAYPSGHATFGGALFQTMRRFFDTARTGEPSFRFVSDEYNGRNRDGQGNIRPFVERTFASFTVAEAENARSRIWNGVHWQIDGDKGVMLGNQVADYVFDHCFVTS